MSSPSRQLTGPRASSHQAEVDVPPLVEAIDASDTHRREERRSHVERASDEQAQAQAEHKTENFSNQTFNNNYSADNTNSNHNIHPNRQGSKGNHSEIIVTLSTETINNDSMKMKKLKCNNSVDDDDDNDNNGEDKDSDNDNDDDDGHDKSECDKNLTGYTERFRGTRRGNQSSSSSFPSHSFPSPAPASTPSPFTSMIYGLTDTPPVHFLFLFALQQTFLVIATPLSTAMVVSDVVCAQNDDSLKLQILSATFFMMGLSTVAMTTVGVRLSIFQGPTAMYIIPLLAMKNLDEFRCPDTFYQVLAESGSGSESESDSISSMTSSSSSISSSSSFSFSPSSFSSFTNSAPSSSSLSSSSSSLLSYLSSSLLNTTTSTATATFTTATGTSTVTSPLTMTLMARLDNGTAVPNRDVALARINAYAGTMILVGVVHFLIGATGMVSLIGRLVGPITIVPVVLLFGISIHVVVVSFAETHWPTALLTSGMIIILGLYLENHNTPIPAWSRSKSRFYGFYVAWQPLHRTFALFLSIAVGWGVCGILTATESFSEDKTSKEYLARTDARIDMVSKTDWIVVPPYPGQFGMPGFSLAALVPFLTSCILSVLDSIGDYNASAKVSGTPPPPSYALNRGIAVEGLMSVLSGALGCTHATVSFGENIGAMGISRVASRSVFQAVGLMYMAFACVGKIGAFFISIPYSVIGGTQIVTFGILIGVILGYLEAIDLRSQRNLSILGISILSGMIWPYWIANNQDGIDTGVPEVDNIARMLLSNPSFIGGFVACVLDNTVPGSPHGRGITSQAKESRQGDRDADSDEDDVECTSPLQRTGNGSGIGTGSRKTNKKIYENSVDVYRLPWLPRSFRRSKLVRIFPMFDIGNDNL